MAYQENQNIEALEAENNEESMAYWCYQCNKEVFLEPREEEAEMVCSECRHGFVEAMATAQRAQHDRMANNARPRRQRHARVETTADSFNRWQVLRFLRSVSPAAEAVIRSEGAAGEPGSRVGNENEGQLSSGDRSQGDDGLDSGHPHADSGDNQRDSSSRQVATEHNPPKSGHPKAADALETDDNEFLDDEEEDADGDNDLNNESDARASSEDEDDEEEDEDEETEENDAWEEVDAGDPREDQGEQPDNVEPDLSSEENTAASNDRDVIWLLAPDRNSQTATMVFDNSRNWELNDLIQGLEDNTIEVRVRYGEDYVNEAGHEILPQNFAENDNTHRGAPPAANSVIEGLPVVVIGQDEIESGTAFCAICQDVIPLGESAKQLPCQHLYHGDCLERWFNSTNSCPICRYELPTDDADDEDQQNHQP